MLTTDMPEDEIKISINDRMMKVIMDNYSVYSDLYEIDCSSCEAVYFGESKRYLNSRSDKHFVKGPIKTEPNSIT